MFVHDSEKREDVWFATLGTGGSFNVVSPFLCHESLVFYKAKVKTELFLLERKQVE